MQALPEAPPVPKKSRGKTVLLTIAVTLGILWVIGTLIEQNETPSTYSPPATSYPTEATDGLTGYDGFTVEESADLGGAMIGDQLCDQIGVYGYSESRQAWITADPQLGSDVYEGALFDEYASRYC